MARLSAHRVELVLVALLALGAWPWIGSLGLWPMAPDSGLWIERGAPIDPAWTEWVFGTRHFHVGYRPVTALTYTLNFLISGLDPFAYRATDLALHLAAAVAVFVVFRRLCRTLSPWAAVFAVALFLAHPAVEQAVPYIARRSYALSTSLALAGIGLWLGPAGNRPAAASLRHVAAGLVLALALLSNEVAVLPIAMLPVLAWSRSGPGPGRVRRCFESLLAPGLILAAALLLRLWVVGGIGGYRTGDDEASRFVGVLTAAWRAAAGLATPSATEGSPLPLLLLGITLPYYVIRCLIGDASRGALGLWIVATTALFALQDVWFPRQGYAFTAPVAMLVACVLFETWNASHSPARRLLELVPQGLLVATLLVGSALVRGPDEQRILEWAARDALISDMVAEIGALEDSSEVHTVLPFLRGTEESGELKGAAARRPLPRRARQPVTWLRLLLRERDIRIKEFAYVLREGPHALALPQLDDAPEPPEIVLPPEREYLLRSGARWLPFDSDATRRLPVTLGEDRAVFVYLAGVAGGDLIPLGR